MSMTSRKPPKKVSALTAIAPPDAKQITKLEGFGIDTAGESMFFSFETEDRRTSRFLVSHPGLAEVIRYLQHIGSTAQVRRLAKPASGPDMDVQDAPHNVARSIHFKVDETGQTSLLSGVTQDGVQLQPVQFPVHLLEQMLANLPSIIAEMKSRQAQRAKTH